MRLTMLFLDIIVEQLLEMVDQEEVQLLHLLQLVKEIHHQYHHHKVIMVVKVEQDLVQVILAEEVVVQAQLEVMQVHLMMQVQVVQVVPPQ